MRNDNTPNACQSAHCVNTISSDWSGASTHMLDIDTNGPASREHEIRDRLLSQHIIYDQKGRVQVTELTLRVKLAYSSGHPRAAELRNAEDESLLAGLFSLVEEGHLAGNTLLASVSPDTLMSPEIECLPAENIAFAVQAKTNDIPALLPRINQLIRCGYYIVLDKIDSDPVWQEIISITQAVRIDVSRFDAIQLDHITRTLRSMGASQLIASHIADAETMEVARQLGFDLFQGAFAGKACTNLRTDPPVNRLRVLELMDRVMAHTDMAEIEALLKMDAILSYRLLRFAKTSGCGMVRDVTSIQQVLQQMGHGALYRWLTLLLHSSSKPVASQSILLKRALSRACFMQALASKSLQPVHGDELYLTGLFSVLEEMFQLPMRDAIAGLNLSSSIKQALVHGNSIHAGFLELALACENNDEKRIEKGAAQCLVSYIDVNIAFINAMVSAEEAAL